MTKALVGTPRHPRLQRKQPAFVKKLIDNPKMTPTQAVKEVYNVKSDKVASVIAAQNMQKPAIVMALAEYNQLFESAIVQTVRDWKDADAPRKREIAMQSAQFAYDHIHGKATVKVEQHASIVRININLASDVDTIGPEEDLENSDKGALNLA